MTDSGWRTVEIGDLCTAIYDGPHATPRKTASGPIFLGISNLSNGRLDLSMTEHLSPADFATWTHRVTPQPGDVVFSYETRLGEAALIPEGMVCCLGRRMGLMRANPEKVDQRFLLYAYLGSDFQETIRERTIHGSTVDRIPLIEFPGFPIRIPHLAEQRAIGRVLGAFDDKIELNAKLNGTLEEVCRVVFAGFAERSSGWKSGRFGDVAVNLRAVVEPKELDPATPYVALDNMPRRSIALVEWGTLDGVSSVKTEFDAGSVLFGKLRPYFHKVGVAPIAGVSSTDILVIEPKSPGWFAFVLLHASSDEFVAHADATSAGTKMPRTNWKDLARYEVALPSEAEAAALNESIRLLVARIVSNIHESRTLAALRDALLPKLISGEIRARDAEKAVEAAT